MNVGDLLAAGPHHDVEPVPQLWGFGGLHGGLTIALLLAAMEREALGPVRSISGVIHRAVREQFTMDASIDRRGRAVTTARATARADHVLATATAVFDSSRSSGVTAPMAISPTPPDVGGPDDGELFVVSPEFVPVAAQTTIHAVGPNRPYQGGVEPCLTAWVRIVDDDHPPDPRRLVFLLDALAPSYAAVLREPVMIPTIELSVRPAAGLADASSPWVLLHATTEHAASDGWTYERIEAWGPDSTHLGSATQLRLLRLT